MAKEKKDQFVALCADSREEAQMLLPMVSRLAEGLRKGVIVFTTSPDGSEWVDSFGLPFAALKCDWPSVVESMPTAFNVVLAVVLCNSSAPRHSLSHPKQLLKNFRQSKIAYLVINSQFSIPNSQFPTVALTLNHQRESKEKLIWASYFARFFHSRILVLHHPYRDAAFLSRWRNNMRYLEKIFSGLGISYDSQPLEGGSEFGNPDLIAISHPDIDLFIALVADQRERDLGDLFASRPELKLLNNKQRKPVLFLNQRDDLYVMCD